LSGAVILLGGSMIFSVTVWSLTGPLGSRHPSASSSAPVKPLVKRVSTFWPG
jgi:hypothetical protein